MYVCGGWGSKGVVVTQKAVLGIGATVGGITTVQQFDRVFQCCFVTEREVKKF